MCAAAFAVMFEGQVLDRYSVELQLPRNHPAGLPVVRETGGRIPRDIDRHIITADGTACVLLPDERWRLWPHRQPLAEIPYRPSPQFLSRTDHGGGGAALAVRAMGARREGRFSVLSRIAQDI